MIRRWVHFLSPRLSLKKVGLLIRQCNLHCAMCSMNANNQKVPQILWDYPGASMGPELTLEEYKKTFRDLQHWRPVISIGGGEPMTFHRMIDLIAFLRHEMAYSVGLTTNGTLFDEERIKGFAETRSSITVSIDGMEETHDGIRGPGAFRKAIGLVQSLIQLRRTGKYRGDVYSLFALHQENYKQLPEVTRFLLGDHEIDSLTVSFLVFSTPQTLEKHRNWVKAMGLPPEFEIHIPRGGVMDAGSLREMDFHAIWEMKKMIEVKYPKVRFEPNFNSFEDMSKYFLTDEVMPEYFGSHCRPASQELALLSNGDVLFSPGCFQIKLGNVREATLQEIWRGEKLKAVRSVLSSGLSPICSHCCGNRIEKHL